MIVLRRHVLRLAGGAAALPLFTRATWAQGYPARPVRVIVPVGPGGQSDTATRLVAQKLSENLKQQFYVENLAGAGGNIGMGAAARAPGDGYTILAAGGSFVVNPTLYARIPYDPIRDFAPVSLLCASPHVLAVHPSVPADTLQAFVALAKANPGKFSYGSAGVGTPAHLAGELFTHAFGVDITHVPFGGGGPAVVSTLGGHTPLVFSALPTAAPHVKAGAIRALGMMSTARSSVLPDVPTMAEMGTPGLEAVVATGFLVRAGTPREVVDLLHREIVKVLAPAEARERLAALGFDTVGGTPEEFAAWIAAEIPKWGKVVRGANIRVQ